MAGASLGKSVLRTPLVRKIWRRVRSEHSWTARVGDFREKELCGLINRPNYTYGMLRAADVARFFGLSAVTVCEFGVATGRGVKNMIEVAGRIQAETGVRFRIVGFDTGAGLPTLEGPKDHPEMWSGGDFAMGDPEKLRAELGGKAELILGDIKDTIKGFRETLTPDCPLGFVSIDVDIYTGTVAALRVLEGPPERYLPAISFYFDDVGSYFNNDVCGELGAINEHNRDHPGRPINVDRSLPGRRVDPVAPWYRSMYVGHILDHQARARPRERSALSLQEHLDFMAALR